MWIKALLALATFAVLISGSRPLALAPSWESIVVTIPPEAKEVDKIRMWKAIDKVQDSKPLNLTKVCDLYNSNRPNITSYIDIDNCTTFLEEFAPRTVKRFKIYVEDSLRRMKLLP